jgi:hypothetical protein
MYESKKRMTNKRPSNSSISSITCLNVTALDLIEDGKEVIGVSYRPKDSDEIKVRRKKTLLRAILF